MELDKTPEAIDAEETLAEVADDAAQDGADGADAKSLADLVDDDAADEKATKAEDEAESEESDTDDQSAETDADAPQMVSYVDDDGKEWEVPEALTPALMKNKDYTTKTQALADERRELEEQRTAFEAEKKRTDEDLQIDGELARLSNLASQYDKLNWDEMFEVDRDDAMHKQFQYGRVREEIARLEGLRQSRSEARLQEAQSATIKRMNEAEEYAKANIPGWSQGKDAELLDFARGVGFDDQTLRENISPAFIKMLYRASLGEQVLNRTKNQTKKAAKEVKPATKIRAKSSPTNRVDLASADGDTYRAAIKAGANPRLVDL